MTPEYLAVEETSRRLKFGRAWHIPESELILTLREKPDAAECPE